MGELALVGVPGPAGWALGALALAALTLAAVAVIRRWRGRARGRARARSLVAAAGPTVAGPVCVRGWLRGGGAVATLAGAGGTHDAADGPVWLECADGARVVLGHGRVVAGTRARTSLVGVPAGTPAALAGRRGRWTLQTIVDGDELVACGIAARIDARSAGYRDDVVAWRLDGDPVELTAVAPAAAAHPLHPGLSAAIVALAALAAYALVA